MLRRWKETGLPLGGRDKYLSQPDTTSQFDPSRSHHDAVLVEKNMMVIGQEYLQVLKITQNSMMMLSFRRSVASKVMVSFAFFKQNSILMPLLLITQTPHQSSSILSAPVY